MKKLFVLTICLFLALLNLPARAAEVDAQAEKEKQLDLLKNAKVPAVIVECGFLSNPQEAEKLGTEKYQKEMAFAVFCGFLQYAEAEEFNKNG